MAITYRLTIASGKTLDVQASSPAEAVLNGRVLGGQEWLNPTNVVRLATVAPNRDLAFVQGKDALGNDGFATLTSLATEVASEASAGPRLRQFYKALYAGATRTGQTFSLPKNIIRVGVFGDSVGDFKPFFINKRLRNALAVTGQAGGWMGSLTLAGGATLHSDVTDGSYWITGSWSVIPTGGSVEYKNSGARALATTLKVYYVKESGGGTFKVQTDTGAGYADEVGYTNVSAYSADTTAGIITLTKADLTTTSIKVVGLTGTVRVIGCTWLYETNGGIAEFHFDVGGLDMDKVMQTPRSIRAVVLNDMALDMATMEWKGEGDFPTNFTNFMTHYLADVTTPTDWVLIGTSPAQDPIQESGGLIVNQTMRDWAEANDQIYFDGYSPLRSWADVSALGWGGDGLHIAQPAHAYVASLLWAYLGLDALFEVRKSNSVLASDITINSRFPGGLLISGNPSAGQPQAGLIGTDSFALDLMLRGGRCIVFQDSSGNNKVSINSNGSFPTILVGGSIGLSAPFTTNGPALRAIGSTDTSGIYSSGLSPGNGSTIAPFAASEFRVGGSGTTVPKWTSGAGSPEGSLTAVVGSLYSRTDGGTGTTLYVKESGTGNTGWVAK